MEWGGPAFVLAIIFMSTAGWVASTWIRARHGYPILDADSTAVGQVTSGAPSLSLGKNVALGYVPSALSRVGTRVAVEIRGQRVAAEVVPTPFYKRKQ